MDNNLFVAIGIAINTLIALITLAYVVLTYHLYRIARKQLDNSDSPVLCFQNLQASVSATFGPGRRNISINALLVNAGTGPAINVRFDAKIISLAPAGESLASWLPARFEPFHIDVLPAGDSKEAHLNFGHLAVRSFFNDVEISHRRNMDRIKNRGSDPAYYSTKLVIFATYHSAVGTIYYSELQSILDIVDILRGDPDTQPSGVPPESESKKLTILKATPSYKRTPFTQRQESELFETQRQRRKDSGY